MKPVILDVDTGIDDALAIRYALNSPELKVVGITTCYGNVPVPLASRNSLAIIESVGGHVPVYQGASQPLVRKAKYAPIVHGEDGLGNQLNFTPKGKISNISAVEILIKTIRENPHEITVIAVGPLTNIAIAVNLAPEIVDLVKEVIIMGGAVRVPGNVTPYGEANIVSDPEAAQIVFQSGLPISLVGLDVTMQTLLPINVLDTWRKSGKDTTLLVNMTEHYMKAYDHFYPGIGGCALHDPLAVAVAIDPSFVKKEAMDIEVVLEGEKVGQTNGNPNPYSTVQVCIDVKANEFLEHFLSRIL